MSDFFRKHDLILSEVCGCMKRIKNLEENIFNNCAKETSSWEVWPWKHIFLEESFIKDKTRWSNRPNFWENKQNSEKFDNETSKLQPVNLSETSGDTFSVMADWLMGCSIPDV